MQVTEDFTIYSLKQIRSKVTLDNEQLSDFVYIKHNYLTRMASMGTAIYNSTRLFFFKSSNIFES